MDVAKLSPFPLQSPPSCSSTLPLNLPPPEIPRDLKSVHFSIGSSRAREKGTHAAEARKQDKIFLKNAGSTRAF